MNIFKKKSKKHPDGIIKYKLVFDTREVKVNLKQIELLLKAINNELKTFNKKTTININPLQMSISDNDTESIMEKITNHLEKVVGLS